MPQKPPAHPSGTTPPPIPKKFIPQHVAVVMDGNGRWANERGLPRNEGHRAGEAALLDIVAGAIEMGIPYISAYAFSTENWKRSPSEVSFIMRFSTEVLNRQLETLKSWGVRIRWAGRRPKLWKNVISQLEQCERDTINHTTCTLTMCVNYGGRADVDLFLRSSGEQRISNFLLWQSAYAEFVFMNVLWPDVDRLTLYKAVEEYASRDRRYGGATDKIPSPKN